MTPTKHDHVIEGLWSLVTSMDGLLHDPVNARSHSERNVDAIKASLVAFKQRTPIVVQVTETGERIVRKGNGTLQAARELGWETLAVVEVVEDHTTATGYAIADNRTAELADWNDNLAQLLSGLQADAPDLLESTGFDPLDLRALLEDVGGGSGGGGGLDLASGDIIQGRLVVTCHLDELDDVREKLRSFVEGLEGVEVT